QQARWAAAEHLGARAIGEDTTAVEGDAQDRLASGVEERQSLLRQAQPLALGHGQPPAGAMKQFGEHGYSNADGHEEHERQDLGGGADAELVDRMQPEEVDRGSGQQTRHDAWHEAAVPGGRDHRRKEREERQMDVPEGIERDADHRGSEGASDRDEITSHEIGERSDRAPAAQAMADQTAVKATEARGMEGRAARMA